MTTTDILLYQTPNWDISIDTHIEWESMRLSLQQIADLYWRDRSGVAKHIKNIIKSWELSQEWTVAKIATVQNEWWREVERELDHYNLDMIISIGYRVDSKQATHFRKRATQTLRSHIMDGYTVNHKRLEQTGTQWLQESLNMLQRAIESKELSTDETQGMLDLIMAYLPWFLTINKYDQRALEWLGQTNEEQYTIDRLDAVVALANLKAQLIAKWDATEYFAHPKDDGGLDAIFWAIYQTMDGVDVYLTVEEKAAMLLYLVIKDHPFVDGNKRSGAYLFIWYLKKNNMLLDTLGQERISHQTLVALALLIATSDTSEKDAMVKLIITILQQ